MSRNIELFDRNPLIETSVDTKGFYLYNWISFEEFRKTVSRDYLWLLSKMLIPFGVVLVCGGIYDFYVLNDTYFFWTAVGLVAVYSLIFIGIIIRMFLRSWTFLRISNIVFTDTHIGIGGEIVPYEKYGTLKDRIREWGEEFEEEFMKPSKIDEKIGQFKAKVFTWGASKEKKKSEESSMMDGCNDLGSCGDIDGCGEGGGEAFWFVIVVFLLVAVYWLSIRLFYGLGWIFSFIIGYSFVGIMKIAVFVQWREEIKIQKLFERLETVSSELATSKTLIVKELWNATQWAWNQWTRGVVDKFDMTIGKAWSGINLVKKLKTTLGNSKYSDIFNYDTFDTWTRNQILEPINEMMGLLATGLEKLDKTIVDLRRRIETTKAPEYAIPLETQLKRLEMQRGTFVTMQNQWKGIGAKIAVGKF